MIETIQWIDDCVVMIDQRRLPLEEKYVTCRTYDEVAAAIRLQNSFTSSSDFISFIEPS